VNLAKELIGPQQQTIPEHQLNKGKRRTADILSTCSMTAPDFSKVIKEFRTASYSPSPSGNTKAQIVHPAAWRIWLKSTGLHSQKRPYFEECRRTLWLRYYIPKNSMVKKFTDSNRIARTHEEYNQQTNFLGICGDFMQEPVLERNRVVQ
jgi:hypothetical protein